MKEETKLKYLIHLRWFYAANYLIAVFEQIALWIYASRTFFWCALILNIISVVGSAIRIGKIEKDLIN